MEDDTHTVSVDIFKRRICFSKQVYVEVPADARVVLAAGKFLFGHPIFGVGCPADRQRIFSG
jgi:hypothetical protein